MPHSRSSGAGRTRAPPALDAINAHGPRTRSAHRARPRRQRTVRTCEGCGLCCTEAYNSVRILPIEAPGSRVTSSRCRRARGCSSPDHGVDQRYRLEPDRTPALHLPVPGIRLHLRAAVRRQAGRLPRVQPGHRTTTANGRATGSTAPTTRDPGRTGRPGSPRGLPIPVAVMAASK